MLRLFRRDASDLVIMVLRFAVGALFVWFGVDKWIHPEAWYAWVQAWTDTVPVTTLDSMLWMMGAAEFALGAVLVGGRLLRGASALAGLSLVAVTLVFGTNDATIRDNAVVGACLALFIHENARAKKPLSEQVVSTICSLYVLFLFICGVLYLRTPVGI